MKNRVGEKWKTNEGCWVTIIEYFGTFNCTIKFEDGSILKGIIYDSIKKGAVKNFFHPSVYGVGYMGVGDYLPTINRNKTIAYTKWQSMLQRCYDSKYHEKKPSYIGCSVHSDWHNFQTFAEWFDKNYVEEWELDKDLLIKGNKFYSAETCCFIPQEINTLFTKSDKTRGEYPIGVNKTKKGRFTSYTRVEGKQKSLGTFDTPEEAFKAYKEAKENQIKRMAISYYTKRKITKEVFKAMINYKVEIND